MAYFFYNKNGTENIFDWRKDMRVLVEGVITSVAEEEKNEKKHTTLLLVQEGEKMQVTVRLPGHVGDQYTPFERATFTGRLMTWQSGRDGVGSMVMADVS